MPLNRAVVVESDVPFAELSIANPGIADVQTLSDKSIYVLGKLPGRTTMTILGEGGKLISNVDVQVTPDIGEFKERLKQILPGENIDVRTANDGIVLSGTVSSAQKLDRALDLAKRYAPDRVSNLLSVSGTQQVMLKVRFAEMQRSVAKNLSSSLGMRGVLGGGDAAVGAIGASGNFTQSGAVSNAFDNGTVPISSDTNGAIGFGFTAGNMEFSVLLEALENKGVVRTLAEPQPDRTLRPDGRFPLPAASTRSRWSKTTRSPCSTSLSVSRCPSRRAWLMETSSTLKSRASVSAIDTSVSMTQGGFSVNAFKKRSTSTTVEMRDGESFAIAGLLQDDFTDLNSQIPWLGDVPVLGALFRSAEYERKQSELVIIVTPHLVSPVKGQALALPTDRVKPPSESDLFLYGKVQGGTKKPTKGPAAEVAKQDFSGSYGYGDGVSDDQAATHDAQRGRFS